MKKHLILIAFMLLSIIARNQVIIGTGQTVSWDPSNPPPSGVEDGIVIEAGATLNITQGCILDLKTDKQIILKKNSRIVIDNSEITGNWWNGFRFDNSQIQGNDIPGVVITKNNSLVSRANVVFKALTNYGGGVQASDSKFENNRAIMEMGPYVYTVGMNTCYFLNCDFYTTMCTHLGVNFFYFINVKNIRFKGCRFMNHCDNTGAKSAIKAFNTKISIEQSTFMNGNPNRRCVFSGFLPASPSIDAVIDINNNIADQTTKVIISNCDFTDIYEYNYNYSVNQRAVYLKGCNNPEVYSNNIDLVSDGINLKHGIFLENCTGFIVEDNEISATAQSGDPVLTYGIIIENSGSQTNEIYRNRLYNTHYGIQGRKKNRGVVSEPYEPEQGLKFLCNEFNSFNTAYYMSAIECNNPDPLFGVSYWQQGAIDGAYGSPNFNSLAPRQLSSSTSYDFHNDHFTPGTWDIQYMLPSGPLGSYAINYISTNIYDDIDQTTTAQDPHCESRLPCVGPLCPALVGPVTKTTYSPNMSTLKTQLSSLVNNGDHSSLMALVENVDARTLATVYDALMSSVPSHDILTIACANEIFSASMIRDILLENSYGIKSWSVRDAIDQRDDQLSPEMMDEIYDAALQLSEYEELMYELDYMNQEYMYVMNRSLDALIGRDSIPMDSVKMYLDSIGDMISFIRLIHFAFEENDISGAGDYYDALVMIADEMEELEYYGLLYEDVLLDIYTNHSGDFSQMDASQINFLYNLIETNTYAAAIGKYLLTVHDDYEWIPEHCEISQNSQRKGVVPEKTSSNQPQLLLYPNPATNRLNVVISGMEDTTADIEIRDVSGKLIEKAHVVSEIGQIDVSLLMPGFYILRVNVKGTVLSKPLIISK